MKKQVSSSLPEDRFPKVAPSHLGQELRTACARGSMEIIDKFRREKCLTKESLLEKSKTGLTPLHWALKNGHVHIAQRFYVDGEAGNLCGVIFTTSRSDYTSLCQLTAPLWDVLSKIVSLNPDVQRLCTTMATRASQDTHDERFLKKSISMLVTTIKTNLKRENPIQFAAALDKAVLWGKGTAEASEAMEDRRELFSLLALQIIDEVLARNAMTMKKTLEVGCGTGALFRLLSKAKSRETKQILGDMIFTEPLAQLAHQAALRNNTGVYCASMSTLPLIQTLREDKIDGIVGLNTLQFLVSESLQEFVVPLNLVLNPGGRAVFFEDRLTHSGESLRTYFSEIRPGFITNDYFLFPIFDNTTKNNVLVIVPKSDTYTIDRIKSHFSTRLSGTSAVDAYVSDPTMEALGTVIDQIPLFIFKHPHVINTSDLRSDLDILPWHRILYEPLQKKLEKLGWDCSYQCITKAHTLTGENYRSFITKVGLNPIPGQDNTFVVDGPDGAGHTNECNPTKHPRVELSYAMVVTTIQRSNPQTPL